MVTTIQAVYSGGVLRPLQPLALSDGTTVQVTVVETQPISDDEIVPRLKAATSIAEWVEATKLLPSDDGGYDIVKALADNRAWSGEHPPMANERSIP